jgi:LacI family transcriptional regulator
MQDVANHVNVCIQGMQHDGNQAQSMALQSNSGGPGYDLGMNQRSSRSQSGGATIADVAKESGFSPMTVSRVINGEKNVKDSTREAVMAAVDKLNYSPNLAARTLAGAEQIRIALLYENPSFAYLSRLLVGTLEQARQSHVQLVIEQCKDGQDIYDVFRELIDSGVDGIVVSPPLCDTDIMVDLIQKTDVVCVVVANWNPPGKMSVVRIDDVEAAAAMTKHIISLGHKRIGFVKGHPDQKASAQRLTGFRMAMEDAGLQIEPEMVVEGLFTYRSGLAAAEQLLNLPQPPTAIFASNDDMAAAAITVAHRRHMDVPHDLTVCGFDDTDFAQSIWPELTTIHQPIAEMSRTAVEILVNRIRSKRAGKVTSREERLLDYTFVQRDSDAPLKTDSRSGKPTPA